MTAMNVLVCPLDWGLGHSSRCVPLIDALLKQGFIVSLGGHGQSLSFLSERFPQLEQIQLAESGIRIGKHWLWGSRSIGIAMRIKKQRAKDLKILKKQEGKFDIVISDNRYGGRISSAFNILLTHQLYPIIPNRWKWFSRFVLKKLHAWFSSFDEIWIPDVSESPGFAGSLSHPPLVAPPCHYIGLLSRFEKQNQTSIDYTWDIAAIVSGPEPHRRSFIVKLSNWLQAMPGKHVILCGGKFIDAPIIANNVTLIEWADDAQIKDIYTHSKQLIARAGYSTLMELICAKRSAVIIPTPGQTEQSYLAKLMTQQGFFFSCSEASLLHSDAMPILFEIEGKNDLQVEKQLVEKQLFRINELLNCTKNP